MLSPSNGGQILYTVKLFKKKFHQDYKGGLEG